LTEDEVLQHIQGKLKLPPSQAYLAQEVDNIVNACNAISAALVGPGESHAHAGTGLWLQPAGAGEAGGQRGSRPWRVTNALGPSRAGLSRSASGGLRVFAAGDVLLAEPGDFTPESKELRLPFAILKAVMAHSYLA